MIARNYDESFAVVLIDTTRGGPNNLYRVIRAALCTLLKVDSNALTLSAIASHPVDLLPLQADGSRGGAIKYAIRPIVHVVAHADFDVGVTEYVTALTAAGDVDTDGTSVVAGSRVPRNFFRQISGRPRVIGKLEGVSVDTDGTTWYHGISDRVPVG